MRTLDEVRADLARLRETARERHAQAPVRRDNSFAPTDFMDFMDFTKPEPEPRDNPESSFAATAFFDFASVKPLPSR